MQVCYNSSVLLIHRWIVNSVLSCCETVNYDLSKKIRLSRGAGPRSAIGRAPDS